MERKSMSLDISPSLLVEATGDSEANSVPAITGDPGLTSSMDGGGDSGGDSDADGDGNRGDEDAASCSSEWSSNKSCNNQDVRDLDCGDVEACDSVDESDRWWWTRETRDNELIEQRWWREAEQPCVSEEEINSFDDDKEINKKPSRIVSSKVHLSEIEKSRLFWEACLAS